MGLDDLKPFHPEEKVIEYLLEAEDKKKRLIDMTCKGFAEETASESPAPGGGSIAAYMGALGAALRHDGGEPLVAQGGVGRPLGGVFRLGRKGATVMPNCCISWTGHGGSTASWRSLPCRKSTDEEKAARSAARCRRRRSTRRMPLRTMRAALAVFPIVRAMAEGKSQFGVGCRSRGAGGAEAVFGARLNVRINAGAEGPCEGRRTKPADAIAAEAERLGKGGSGDRRTENRVVP